MQKLKDWWNEGPPHSEPYATGEIRENEEWARKHFDRRPLNKVEMVACVFGGFWLGFLVRTIIYMAGE